MLYAKQNKIAVGNICSKTFNLVANIAKSMFFKKRDYDMTKNVSFFALVVESENKGKLLMRNLRY